MFNSEEFRCNAYLRVALKRGEIFLTFLTFASSELCKSNDIDTEFYPQFY